MAQTFTIRPFEYTDSDYEQFAAVENAVWPEYPDTVEELKHSDATRDSKYLFHRFVAEVEGRIVASGIYCEPWWSARPGKYFINLSVHPDHRRRGIGTALYDLFTGRLAELEPVLLIAHSREDQPDALHFLDKRGYKQVMRSPISYLDVPKFDPVPFAGAAAKAEELGIHITTLAELSQIDDDWQRKFYELDWEIMQDVPTPEPLTKMPFENFRKRVFGHPGFCPEAQFIALDSDEWVGLSGLWTTEGDPAKLYTGLTGVVRSHRRKGIATTMKVQAISFAKDYGAKLVETDNEENNPMFFLNLKLGFEAQPAWLSFELHL